MRKSLILIIKIYQRTLSPDHGLFKARWPHGYCRYYPSCSEYTIEALDKHGIFKGTFLATKRVLRCNPFAAPSVDPVPKV